MVKGFWAKLKKPLFVLAPMANVTDAAFRSIIAKYGKPDVMWTEFVSCDGLCSAGREKLLMDFWFTEKERPIVAQIFGSKPENVYQSARLCRELGFDGIDINMGCPDRSIEKQGAGAAMIKNPELAKEIIRQAQKGAGELPVSIKTRLGYGKITIEEWLPHLLEVQPAAITIHGRTRKEMSLVPARWDAIGQAAELARRYDSSSDRTLILGNGDVKDLDEAESRVREFGVDGVMIGRGIFGNPWLFNRERRGQPLSLVERFSVMIEHTYLFEKLFTDRKGFDTMEKHYKAYVNGFDGAKELRIKLMAAKNADEVREIIQQEYPNFKSEFAKFSRLTYAREIK